MTKLTLVNNLSRAVHKAGFQLKKHSPEILIVAGVVGTVTSAVMACRATTKLKAVMETANEKIDTIHYCTEKGYTTDPETKEKVTYTEEDAKKDLVVAYAGTAIDIVKLYAPSVILGALSLTGIVASNHILRQRNIALAAAYATVDKSFKAYRGRVVERFGKELDHELRHGIKAVEVEETVVDEKGKEKKVKKTIDVIDPNGYSEYSRIFDDGCLGWTKDAELNYTFAVQQQNWFNDLLKLRGYVFLNEVYDAFGIPRTKAGQIVGWVYDTKNPDHKGDNFIDFGIFNTHSPKARDFVNGYERVLVMDFNVDGNILNYL